MIKRTFLMGEEETIRLRNIWRNLPSRQKEKCGAITAALCAKEAEMTLGQLSQLQQKLIRNHIIVPQIVADRLLEIQSVWEDEQQAIKKEKKVLKIEVETEKQKLNTIARQEKLAAKLLQIEQLKEKNKNRVHSDKRAIQLFNTLKLICKYHGETGAQIYKDFVNSCVDVRGNFKFEEDDE